MKEFKKFPKLEYTGVRGTGGKIKVVYKKFALQFIRWRFPFTQQGQYADDSNLVKYLAKDDTQTLFLRDAPAEVEPLFEKEVEEVEKITEGKPHEQAQKLAQLIDARRNISPKKIVYVPNEEEELKKKTETISGEKTPIPKPFIKAFENEPDYKLDPTSPPTPQKESLPIPQIHLPEEISSPLKTAGSNAGIFFQRTIGKRLTATGIASAIGGFVGAGLSGGNPLAIAAGAGTGALLANSDSARQALGDLGNQAGKQVSSPPRQNYSRRPNFLSNFRKPSKKVLWIFLGLFFVLVFTTGFMDSSGGGLSFSVPPPGTGTGPRTGPINSCKFTRSNNPQLIKSSILQGWITASANNVGIPAAVLASIAMHEGQNFLISKGDDSPEMQSGQYCVDGTPVCVNMKTNKAISEEACTPTQLTSTDPIYKTAIARGLLQLLDIYQDPSFPFCDIKANIQKAAQTLKGKLGSGSWSNENDAKKAVCGYFGKNGTSCTYPGGFDYAKEAWDDYQNCKAITTTPVIPPPGPPGPIPEGPVSVVYYCQGNTSWASTCSLGSAGCGPTTVAMILSSYGYIQTPPQVDQTFQTNRWRTCGYHGSQLTTAISSSWFSGLGFEKGPNLVSGTSFDVQEAKKYIDQGYLIIGSSRSFPCANCRVPGALVDHIYVVGGVDPVTNTVDIRDPNNCSYADGNDENQAKRFRDARSFAWYYAYPVKRVR